MKKITRMMMYAGMASILAFASCKKDDDTTDDTTPPTTTEDVKLTMTVAPADITSFPKGEAIVIHSVCAGNSTNALKTLKLSAKITIDGVSATMDTTITLSGVAHSQYDTLEFDENGAEIEISGVLTGEKGSASVASLPKMYTNTILNMTTPIIVGNQADGAPKFWSARLNEIKNLSDAVGNTALQKDLDFGYVSRSTANGGNKLISPASDDATDIYSTQWSNQSEKITNWIYRNTTGFIKVNSKISLTDFNNLSLDTDSLINLAKEVGEPSNPSVPVLANDIYLYRVVKGTSTYPVYYYGLVRVSNPTGDVVGGVATAGNVTLTIRYQREH